MCVRLLPEFMYFTDYMIGVGREGGREAQDHGGRESRRVLDDSLLVV